MERYHVYSASTCTYIWNIKNAAFIAALIISVFVVLLELICVFLVGLSQLNCEEN